MSSFKLSSDNSEFNNRVDALFSCLQTAAVDHEPNTQSQNKRTREESPPEESDLDEHSGRIGQKFRKPAGLPPNWHNRGRGRSHNPRNSTPDYVKNPNNWTRYSMKDTKVSSDRENKQIGLELFDEMRSRRMETEEGGQRVFDGVEESTCPTKIVFKKPQQSEVIIKEKCETNLGSSVDELFGGTKKFRMKEYAVGQSKPKVVSKASKKNDFDMKGKKDIVSLDYLTYEDEEDD